MRYLACLSTKKDTKNNGVVLPMDLRAKKSWFVVDGMTIALGAGITGNDSG